MSSGEQSGPGRTPTPGSKRPIRRIWYLLLVLPFAATLVPPFYAREAPMAGPWPFFYWWQFAWIVITALILAFVYHVTTGRGGRD